MVAVVIAGASCKKEPNELQAVSLKVTVALDQALSGYTFNLADAEITATNLTSGKVNTAKADASGVVNFSSISPGNYDVKATLTVKAEDYTTITGTFVEDDVVLNGTLTNKTVSDASTSLNIDIKAGRVGGWVFKQIYYAGSHTSNGASFRDQFIEIYNNSNEILYADSLYFAQVEGVNTRLSSIDFSLPYLRSNGQYDWTKSIGMNDVNANENYTYARSLFMIPGTGKQHAVLPGKSIIIAGTALNHKAPFTNNTGKEVTVKDPSLTVDLSGADFEVYLGDFPGNTPLATDMDNPAITNMVNYARGVGKDLILDATGRDAYVLFKSSQPVSAWKKYPSPDETSITTSTDYFYQVPNTLLLDAVQIQVPLETSRIPRKLHDGLDAGPVFVSKGQYSSQSLIRKTSKTVNGRVVLKDTNNSANDFTELNTPDVTKSVFK